MRFSWTVDEAKLCKDMAEPLWAVTDAKGEQFADGTDCVSAHHATATAGFALYGQLHASASSNFRSGPL